MASKAKINTILTSVCPECKHCTLDEQSKAIIKIKCAAHDKIYNYGQRVECNEFKRNETE